MCLKSNNTKSQHIKQKRYKKESRASATKRNTLYREIAKTTTNKKQRKNQGYSPSTTTKNGA